MYLSFRFFYAVAFQDTFRKAASGLLAVADAGRAEAVRAVSCLEASVGEVKISFFKGWESMVPPDLRELIDMELINWDVFLVGRIM